MKFHLLSFLIFTSCFKPDSPEVVLKDFIDARIGKVIDREFILERVTGKMRENIQRMSAKEFENFADMKAIKSNSFKILSKSCQESKCFLTYSISYLTKSGDVNQFSSEVQKLAELIKTGQKWLIADVSNIQTYHRSLEPIHPLE